MSRPKRILYCHRVAHVYSHTIPEIILTDEDRALFESVMRRYTRKNGYVTYFNTILSNHFHQTIQCFEDTDCSKHPQVIKQEMTRAYNQRHGRKGTIWWDRYGDVTILGEHQLWKTVIYQACNQTRAGLAQNPLQERFSSMANYLGQGDDGITTLLPQYLELGETPEERQAAFKEMVLEAMEIYSDVDAYARAEAGKGIRRLDESWARDLRAMEAHERKHLEKRRDEQAIIIVVSPQSEDQDPPSAEQMIHAAEEASEEQQQPQEQQAILLSQEDRDELLCRGIPDRVLCLFFGPKDQILQMVRDHYQTFRLHVPP